jgi:hypothetical protein
MYCILPSVTTEAHHLDCFDIEQPESSHIAATAGASTESDAQSSSSFCPTGETKRRTTSVLHSEQLHAPQFSSLPTSSGAGITLCTKSTSPEFEQLPRHAERQQPASILRSVLRNAFDNPDEYGLYMKPVSSDKQSSHDERTYSEASKSTMNRFRPMSILVADMCQGYTSLRPCSVLLDPGSDISFINE